MNILLIDSTSSHCYVAVVQDNNIIDGSRYSCGTKHSEILCRLVGDVLAKAELTFAQVDSIACGIGTGSFTGIRIGVSTVLGYHQATGVPMIALPSLMAMHIHSGNTSVAMDSGNGYYYAQYNGTEELYAPELVSYDDDRVVGAYVFDKETNYLQAYATLARMLYSQQQYTDSLVPLYIRKSQAEMNI